MTEEEHDAVRTDTILTIVLENLKYIMAHDKRVMDAYKILKEVSKK